MNRQMRRQADRAKRLVPRKPRNWSLISKPLPHELDQAFGPVDNLLLFLANGETECTAAGIPIFKMPEGTYFETAPALSGFVSALNRIFKHHSIALDLNPITKLCNKLQAGMQLTPEHVQQCQQLVDECRAAYRQMDVFVISRLARTEEIALQLETINRKSTPKPN